MNTDFRVDIGFQRHLKTVKLKRAKGAEGVLSLLRLWAFAAAYRPAGILGDSMQDIAIAAETDEETVQEFIAVGYLDHKKEHGRDIYAIHDWEKHNGYCAHAKERSEAAKKGAAARWKKSNADSMPTACGEQSKRNAPSPTPTPTPTPAPNSIRTPQTPLLGGLSFSDHEKPGKENCPANAHEPDAMVRFGRQVEAELAALRAAKGTQEPAPKPPPPTPEEIAAKAAMAEAARAKAEAARAAAVEHNKAVVAQERARINAEKAAAQAGQAAGGK